MLADARTNILASHLKLRECTIRGPAIKLNVVGQQTDQAGSNTTNVVASTEEMRTVGELHRGKGAVRFVGLSWLFLSLSGFVAEAGQDWTAADIATTRLKPAAFTEVPSAIRAELARRGCMVPQPHDATQRANVLSGKFTSDSQVDWAALCSRERVSVILVFRGGSTTEVAELARAPDRDYLQTVGGGIVGFSRGLGVASATFIRGHHDPVGDAPLPRLDHDGIDDRFIGKGSVVWYWSGGRWLQLAGSD
jgi:hypothetical protein